MALVAAIFFLFVWPGGVGGGQLQLELNWSVLDRIRTSLNTSVMLQKYVGQNSKNIVKCSLCSFYNIHLYNELALL